MPVHSVIFVARCFLYKLDAYRYGTEVSSVYPHCVIREFYDISRNIGINLCNLFIRTLNLVYMLYHRERRPLQWSSAYYPFRIESCAVRLRQTGYCLSSCQLSL